ncbi:hypothetical protein J9978_09380 [Chromobacterium violaceum]|uniref:hypothetical protein n=1 Tax=Chromobacterium violaceum TaxID=536 RepID=UPI001B3242B6|nr:hypothetical protein [Chromobacterium violaceum]MBP4049711.1 hypothetical protein [Chromobacterium violaceum]
MKKMYKADSSVTVTNANGTADRKCSNCGTWLEHWEKYSTYTAGKCSISDCNNSAEVGAHVLRPHAENEDYKTHPYIIPMCKTHNGKGSEDEMKTKGGVEFVWANVKETCGK